MFVDYVVINVAAGTGGSGAEAFRREMGVAQPCGEAAIDRAARQGIQIADDRVGRPAAFDPVAAEQGDRLCSSLPAAQPEMRVDHLEANTIDQNSLKPSTFVL